MPPFRFTPGEVRVRTRSAGGRGAETEGSLDRPALHYEGPSGPIEVFIGDGLRTTRIAGPLVPEITLPWGPASPEEPAAARARLRNGIGCALRGRELTFRQPRYGIRRSRRALHIDGLDRQWIAIVRRLATRSVERPGGPWVARAGMRRRGEMAPSADEIDVVVAVLLFGSNLIAEIELGYGWF